MPTKGSAQYFDHTPGPLPKYESYDGNHYSGPLERGSHGGANGVANGGNYEDDVYNTPVEERASHQIGLNTRMRSQNLDAVGHHMLYETAMMDTQSYEILDMAEVDALKKEHARLDSRMQGAKRKLALESKVKDAALNLQRLYSVNGKGRPDTPQSPGSPKKSRSSLLSNRGRTSSSGSGMGSGHSSLHQAEDELAVSTANVDQLKNSINSLLDRRQNVERKLLRHTAAVLAEQASRASKKISGTTLGNGDHVRNGFMHEDDSSSMYMPDEFDGIRDILHGVPIGTGNRHPKSANAQKLQEEHEQQMASVQSRVEQLNGQLRYVIAEASRIRGVSAEPEPDLDGEDDDSSSRIDSHLTRLEHTVASLQQEQEDVKTHFARVQDSAHTTRDAIEEQLEELNRQFHNSLLLGSDMQDMETLREPPSGSGQGYQPQLEYLEDSLQHMENLLRRQRSELESARENSGDATRSLEDAHAKVSTHVHKLDEYEATLGGLWGILQSDMPSRRPSFNFSGDKSHSDEERRSISPLPSPSPVTPMREDFSMQAFSSRVQHLYDRTQGAKEAQDILRRQIQQQRELGGKSDAEKDAQILALQERCEGLETERETSGVELQRALEGRAVTEGELGQARGELMNVMNELEGIRKTVEQHQQEREDSAKTLETHESHAATLAQQIDALEAKIADLTDDARIASAKALASTQEADARRASLSTQLESATAAREAAERDHHGVKSEMEGLESEVVRLTTELAMARAELDGAYGSRAERAREAQGRESEAELESLKAEHEALKSTHAAALVSLESARGAAAAAERQGGLERELEDMTKEFEVLAREAAGFERERVGFEGVVDALREKCEGLEAKLGDERVRTMGIGGSTPAQAGEGVSMRVLRGEFKKMMREARAEGVRALRVSTCYRIGYGFRIFTDMVYRMSKTSGAI